MDGIKICLFLFLQYVISDRVNFSLTILEETCLRVASRATYCSKIRVRTSKVTRSTARLRRLRVQAVLLLALLGAKIQSYMLRTCTCPGVVSHNQIPLVCPTVLM